MKGDVVDKGWIGLAPSEGLIRPPFFENIIEDDISSTYSLNQTIAKSG
jgi:hypothetical protein